MENKDTYPEVITNYKAPRNVLTHETVQTIHYTNVLKEPKKRIKLKHFLEIEYNFLQFIGLVFSFQKLKTGLNQRVFETILYLYPLGIFDAEDMRKSQRHYVNDKYTLDPVDYYIKLGLVTNFYYKKNKEYIKQYYVLTDKAKKICEELHLYCLGEMPMDDKHENHRISQFRRTSTLWGNIKWMNEYKQFKKLSVRKKYNIDTLMKDIKTYKMQLRKREKEIEDL